MSDVLLAREQCGERLGWLIGANRRPLCICTPASLCTHTYPDGCTKRARLYACMPVCIHTRLHPMTCPRIHGTTPVHALCPHAPDCHRPLYGVRTEETSCPKSGWRAFKVSDLRVLGFRVFRVFRV